MTYTLDETVAVAREIIAELGEDYVYDRPHCAYRAEDGSPSCLVGRIFARLGLNMDEIFPRNNNSPGGFTCNWKVVDCLPGLGFDSKAWRFLTFLQAGQDNRRPYGECLLFALERLNEVSE